MVMPSSVMISVDKFGVGLVGLVGDVAVGAVVALGVSELEVEMVVPQATVNEAVPTVTKPRRRLGFMSL
jgi:uncharacterized protein (DUF111 family)